MASPLRSGTGAVTLDNLSTIPRKLEQQLKPNMSRNLRDSKSKKWKALQHSMSVLQHMKKTSSSTMQDLSLDEMVNAIQAGQVSLEALLAAFQRVRTTQPRVELDDVFTEAMESNASLLRSPSRHANIWTSGMQRSIQPPPRGRPMRKPVLPQDAGPGLRLPQLLTPREKGSVQHVNSIHVDAVAPKEAKKSATHGVSILASQSRSDPAPRPHALPSSLQPTTATTPRAPGPTRPSCTDRGFSPPPRPLLLQISLPR